MNPENTTSDESATIAVESPKSAPKKPAKVKTTAKSKATKPAAKSKAKLAPANGNKMSLMDAAAKVLSSSKEPMNTKAMVEAVTKKGLWNSPAGKTPAATLYSSILREMETKGTKSRFRKKDKGLFIATVHASK